MKNREKETLNAIVIITGIFLATQSFYYLYFANYAKDNIIASILITVVIPIIILLIGKEYIVKGIVFLIKLKKNKEIVGNWSIVIEFEENNIKETRTGHLEVKENILGLEIKGNKICKANAEDITTMESWIGENLTIESISGNKKVLHYVYTTKESKKPDKIGLVVAVSSDSKEFIGIFRDLPKENIQVERSGTVRLVKS